MVRFLTVLIGILFLNALGLRAQDGEQKAYPIKTTFGLKAGANLAILSASVNSETRSIIGPALGFFMRKQTSAKVSVRAELYYSNQGQKDNYLYPYGGPSLGHTKTNMHYINVPLLFELGRKVTFQFGLQPGLLVAGKETGTVSGTKIDNNLKDVFTKGDLAVVAGFGLNLGERISAGLRVNYGVINIYQPESKPNSNNDPSITVQNRVLHFYLGYAF